MNRTLVAVMLSVSAALAQSPNPVSWTATADDATPGGTLRVHFKATLEPGWHIYSLTTPQGGPTPTTIKPAPGTTPTDAKLYQPKPAVKFDPTFKVNTEIFRRQCRVPARLTCTRRFGRGIVFDSLSGLY